MKKETRTVVYDEELRIEAYCFEGIVQPFPNHFHEHYVIGFVENGQRILSCKNKDYSIECGNVVLFNPGDNHSCIQRDDGTFYYRGFHISTNIMLDLAEEITGKRELPGFSKNVIYDDEITCYLRSLHEMIMSGISDFGKEENLLFLISALIQKCYTINVARLNFHTGKCQLMQVSSEKKIPIILENTGYIVSAFTNL